MESIQSVQELQQCVLAATDPMSASKTTALSMLNHMCNTYADGGSQLCVQMINHVYEKAETEQMSIKDRNETDSVIFYALTTVQRALSKRKNDQCIVPSQCRDTLRQVIYQYIFRVNGVKNVQQEQMMPTYLRTKIGVVLALLIQIDFPNRWQDAFQELIQLAEYDKDGRSVTEIIRKDIFLRTLDAVCDEVVEDTSIEQNTVVKDCMRGIACSFSGAIPLQESICAAIINAIITIFKSKAESMISSRGKHIGALETQKLPIYSLSVLKRFISWIDLSLILHDSIILLLLSCLSHAGPGDAEDDNGDGSLPSQCGTEAVECFKEIISKGMENDKKVQMIMNMNILQRIEESGINLDTVDGTHINIVIKISELVTTIGLELINFWESISNNQLSPSPEAAALQTHLNVLVRIFFKCFCYDDIDVSGAVIPLASQFVSTLQKEMNGGMQSSSFRISNHMPQLLAVMYQQMKYPLDFEFDYEDEDDAEEEMYRTELRKLNQTIIRVCPEMALQFLRTSLSKVQAPLSTAQTSDIEAALRLIYHYCEGVRPPPGSKAVLKNQMFRDVLVALHTSDITSHPHREILILYYDIAVRYSDILQDKPELLPNILTSISGDKGLQHQHPRVRSRSCYLLLKLVKALGPTLRPFVETAIGGILSLLSNQVLSLHPEDSLYLFETIGLLLGRTSLSDDEQQGYLIAVMTPHMQMIDSVLKSSDINSDPDTVGDTLSFSVASLAFLTKGFNKNISPGVQAILAETTHPCLNILRAIPTHAEVRNKTMIYLQRMILCLGENILLTISPFLEILIRHCGQDDLLDVAQILHQLCRKFKADAMPVADANILPLLQKAADVMPNISGQDQADLPSHILTEFLHVKKIIFVSLFQVVNSNCSPILLSPRNVGSLEHILRTVGDGAMSVPDPLMKKTCVQFFQELTDQWLGNPNNGNDASMMRGYQTYLLEEFLPGMFNLFFSSEFNEKDAMQFRVVRETAGILFLLKSKCGVQIEQIIARIVASKGAQSTNILAAINTATSKADIEKCIKSLLQSLKYK